MRHALIDTGAIYARVARTDHNHAAAARFLKSWLAQGGLFVQLRSSSGRRWVEHHHFQPRLLKMTIRG